MNWIKQNLKKIFIFLFLFVVLIISISFYLNYKKNYEISEKENEIAKDQIKIKIDENNKIALMKQKESEFQYLLFLKSKMQEIKQKINFNNVEFEKNNTTFKKYFSEKKVSFDSELTELEDEQDFQTAFSVKADLDEKKDSIVKLGSELEKNHGSLVNDFTETQKNLNEYSQNFEKKYGERLPFHKELPIPDKTESQKQMEEQMKQMKKYSEPMTDVLDGTGRAQLQS
tara:strand:+ start:1719 stop:2402 length:684 start_codon:yes stop_codon:yes gene_type:complete